MKCPLLAALAVCVACLSLPASALPVAKPQLVDGDRIVLVKGGHGHGHHYGWGRGRGHHYGWYRGHHHGWYH
jgi:hypothetical protein